jgi:sodium/proline symporter
VNAGTISAFVVYVAAVLGIGVPCYRLTSSQSDYILGGRRLPPGVAALSAGASDMSGWLLLGLPGAVYLGGMSQIWIAVGLVIGAYLNWQFVARRLRVYTEVARDSLTVPDYLENRFLDRSHLLRIVSAVVILLFSIFYVSAGLVAGGLVFEKSFGLDYAVALWVGAAVIVSYTVLGGFLAVSWTDFFQGIMMFIAIILVPVVAAVELGGFGAAAARVAEAQPGFDDVFHGTTLFGIISLMAWGLGYFGQPHILARFMAVRSSADIPAARLIGMTWMVLALYGAIFTGYLGVAYFAGQPLEDPEAVFVRITQALFNPWVAGFLLAAVLAAVMSTIDSQLLVCASVISEDFYKGLIRPGAGDRELVALGRAAVVVIALVAALLALDPGSRILDLVAYAWAGLGASLGPVVLLSLFSDRVTRTGAVAGLVVGAATVVVWRQLEGGLFDMNEIVPGFILGTFAVVFVSLFDEEPTLEVREEFADAMLADAGVAARPSAWDRGDVVGGNAAVG